MLPNSAQGAHRWYLHTERKNNKDATVTRCFVKEVALKTQVQEYTRILKLRGEQAPVSIPLPCSAHVSMFHREALQNSSVKIISFPLSCLVLGPSLVVLKASSRLCAQELLPAVTRGPYGICHEASSLHTIQLLQLPNFTFLMKKCEKSLNAVL